MPRRSRSLSPLLALLCPAAALLAGCPATVGGTRCTTSGSGEVTCVRTEAVGCDEFTTEQARLLVYRDDGEPYYAGQALLLESCASCHATSSTARYGAPATMDFDADLVRAAGSAGLDELRHLRDIQATIHRHRDLIYEQVVEGAMPPPNFVPVGSRYQFPDGRALPGIRDPEAHEILRHWLSCGSPVIERTTMVAMPCSADGDCSVTGACNLAMGQCWGVGDVEPARSQTIEPRWSQIYNRIVAVSCGGAGGACHIGGSAGGLNLDSAAIAYSALVGQLPGAASVSCTGETSPYVDPGNANGSLLVHKVEGVDEMSVAVCGSRMPIGPALSTDQITAIRMWIDLGAMND